MLTYTKYVLNTLPIIILFIPFYGLARFIRVKTARLSVNLYREAGLFVFALYLVWLATQTIVPNISIIDEFWSLGQPGFGEVNLDVFKVFKQTYHEVFLNKNASYFFINFIGNILVFIPISFFFLLLFKEAKRPVLSCLLLGFVISLFIEFVQFFIERGCDIDDLWLNTLGALLGCLIFTAFKKRCGGFFDRFKPAKKTIVADDIKS